MDLIFPKYGVMCLACDKMICNPSVYGYTKCVGQKKKNNNYLCQNCVNGKKLNYKNKDNFLSWVAIKLGYKDIHDLIKNGYGKKHPEEITEQKGVYLKRNSLILEYDIFIG